MRNIYSHTQANINKYDQLRDYLVKLKKVPIGPRSHKITSELIAEVLEYKPRTVRTFINGHSKIPKKLLNNFIRLFPKEYETWPKGCPTIDKVLNVSDAYYFLGIKAPHAQNRNQPDPHLQIFVQQVAITPSLSGGQPDPLQPAFISPFSNTPQSALQLPLPRQITVHTFPMLPEGPITLAPINSSLPNDDN